MQRIIATSDNLASVLMGYNIDAGWRHQSDLNILVDYNEWKAFIQRYGSLRYSIHSYSMKMYYFDLSIAQYNEVLWSSSIGRDATLLLPYSGDKLTKDEYIQYMNAFDTKVYVDIYNKVQIALRNYFRCIDVNSNINIDVNESRLSDWNRLLFRLSLSYQLLPKLISIDWR